MAFEQNNIDDILIHLEGVGHKATGTWGYCRYCQRDYNHKCTNSFAIYCDEKLAKNPRVIVEQKYKPRGWINLCRGINYFYWCVRANENIRLIRNEEEKNWFWEANWIIIYPDVGTSWLPLNIPFFKSSLDQKTVGTLDSKVTLYNPSSRRIFRISQLLLMCKDSSPPSLSTFSKLTILSKYFKGKRGREFLPIHLKISKHKVVIPTLNEHLDQETQRLDTVKIFELIGLPDVDPYGNEFFPPGLAESPSESENEFSVLSSDSGIEDQASLDSVESDYVAENDPLW
jgi:hypothetical protein